MHAVDTNVLLYAHDPRDVAKQTKAIEVLRTLEDGVILWQVACEYLAASRKLEQFGMSRTKAWQYLSEWRQAWALALPNWDVLQSATYLMERYSLSHWDAMLLAAAAEARIEVLYSEDFGGSADILGVRLVNPFKD